MARPFPEALRAPVTDLDSAKAWIAALVANSMDFHLEDDPADIINLVSGEDLFGTDDVVLLVRERLAAIYAVPHAEWGEYDCPIGYMLDLMGE